MVYPDQPRSTSTESDSGEGRWENVAARAAVETVMMQGGSLLWCAHHFAFFEDALNAFGATILVDERRR
jgi:hypothetical protein